jgi:dihydrofolate synthase / folylpolyglutamate synthase
MDLDSALTWLYGTQLFGIKPGLDGMLCLLELVGNPHRQLRFIHVAGTNGKGSTCAFLAAGLQSLGYKVGLFTSPHLISFTERIQINRQPIAETGLAELLQEMQRVSPQRDPHPTFFEITTALAMRHFQNERCDYVVLETGMGGRLDATNVVTPVATVLTPVSFDHQKWLGDTLEKIAGEKAGIIKPQVPVFTSPQAPEVLEVFRKTAASCAAPLTEVTEPWPKELPLGLRGDFQRWNASLAETVLHSLFPAQRDFRAAFAEAHWAARFQKIGSWVLDGAHNAHGAAVLAEAWRAAFPGQRATLLFSAVADKDHTAMLQQLLPLAQRVLVAPVSSARRLESHELAALVKAVAPDLPVEQFSSIAEAKVAAERHAGLHLCVGSLYLCGEMLSLLQFTGPAFEPSLQ